MYCYNVQSISVLVITLIISVFLGCAVRVTIVPLCVNSAVVTTGSNLFFYPAEVQKIIKVFINVNVAKQFK